MGMLARYRFTEQSHLSDPLRMFVGDWPYRRKLIF